MTPKVLEIITTKGLIAIPGYQINLTHIYLPWVQNYTWYVHKVLLSDYTQSDREWVVSEGRSGMRLTTPCPTRKEAVAAAESRLFHVGEDKFKSVFVQGMKKRNQVQRKLEKESTK